VTTLRYLVNLPRLVGQLSSGELAHLRGWAFEAGVDLESVTTMSWDADPLTLFPESTPIVLEVESGHRSARRSVPPPLPPRVIDKLGEPLRRPGGGS
jgi:hypothetical protein